MSHDIDVYATRALPPRELAELIEATPGLHVGARGESQWRVTRGPARVEAFGIDGPFGMDDTDVPPDVAARIFGARVRYELHVDGGPEHEPAAHRLARRLARQTAGAVLDPATGEVWSRQQARPFDRPQRDERVAAVEVEWHCLRERLAGSPSATFATLAQRLFPEAAPHRFGTFEPLQGRLAQAGIDGLSEAARDGQLFFAGRPPVAGGHVDAERADPSASRFWHCSLELLAAPLHESGWRSSLQRFFIALADELPAVCAVATVHRGAIWSGRSLGSDGYTERSTSIHSPGRWAGLSPEPAWWEWYGPDYVDLVRERLPAERLVATKNGLLRVLAEAPTATSGPPAHDRISGRRRRAAARSRAEDGRTADPKPAGAGPTGAGLADPLDDLRASWGRSRGPIRPPKLNRARVRPESLAAPPT